MSEVRNSEQKVRKYFYSKKCIPKYICTSRGALYGLGARKLKRWNEPFIHSNGIRIFFRES